MAGIVDRARRAYYGVRNLACRFGADCQRSAFGSPMDAWSNLAYHYWFQAHEVTAAELERQRATWLDFSEQPVFSFIVPLYQTPSEYLQTMAQSVLIQSYPKLELVLVNASPEVERLALEVEELRRSDNRVVVINLEENRGITENTNYGIAASTGDFCCFLDHDDYIDGDLLFEYVRAINDNPETDVLYCDEDLVVRNDRTGEFRHQNPLFKPQFAPELLLSRNYVIHLMTVRRSIIESMPTPDASFDGSQDFNMALFATNAARRVQGVQRVMYHWRVSDVSTALNLESKPYCLRSCRKSIYNQLKRRGLAARLVSSGVYLHYNPWFDHSDGFSCTVIADVSDCEQNLDWFSEFAQQMFDAEGTELIIVGTTADVSSLSVEMEHASILKVDSSSRLERYNAAAAAAQGEFLVFIDADCVFATPEPIEQLVAFAGIDGVGISAPKLVYRDHRVKSFGVAVTPDRVMPLYRGFKRDASGYLSNLRVLQNASAAALQGLCIRRPVFESLGGFGASFGPELGAVDLCKRVRDDGLRLVVTPTVELEVNEYAPADVFNRAVNAPDYPSSDVEKYDAKWPGDRGAGDPYFNRNLDQASNYLQLPPRK